MPKKPRTSQRTNHHKFNGSAPKYCLIAVTYELALILLVFLSYFWRINNEKNRWLVGCLIVGSASATPISIDAHDKAAPRRIKWI